MRWYVFDDRKLYRPGEEVHLKGWIRRIGAGKNGDVGALNDAIKGVSYRVKDEAGNEVAKGELTPNLLGGIDASFKLPTNMNLGNAQVEFETIVRDIADDRWRCAAQTSGEFNRRTIFRHHFDRNRRLR